MGALGIVELERAGQPFQDELGDAAGVSAFQALVVLDADAGQRGDLLAAQAGHPTLAVAGQAGLLGGDPRPAGGQELGDVVGWVHEIDSTRVAAGQGCPVSTPLTGPPRIGGSALS